MSAESDLFAPIGHDPARFYRLVGINGINLFNLPFEITGRLGVLCVVIQDRTSDTYVYGVKFFEDIVDAAMWVFDNQAGIPTDYSYQGFDGPERLDSYEGFVEVIRHAWGEYIGQT